MATAPIPGMTSGPGKRGSIQDFVSSLADLSLPIRTSQSGLLPACRQTNTDQDQLLIGEFAQRQSGTQAGIEISITESLSECGECRFPSAVAGCDVVHFELVTESCNDPINVRVTRRHEMKPSDNQMNAGINRARRCDDFVNARM